MSSSNRDIQATIPTSPIVWTETGELRTEWRAFFRRLWTRTGGSQGGVGGGTITGVTAGTGLQGGGTSGTVTVSLIVPVTIVSGGTGATTAPLALQNLGALALAGGTMTGALVLPNGTIGAPSLAVGAVDGTGLSRSGAALIMGIQGSPLMAMFASGTQFYQPLNMLNNRITQVADATAATDALNQRTGDARYAPVASPAFTGTPTAPTQAPLDNSTKLATTAYADNLNTFLWG